MINRVKKILCVFGTRPEAIKMAPLVKHLSSNENFESRVCVTAQHREMLDQALQIFKVKPDYDLGMMVSEQSLQELTGKILVGMKPVFDDFSPDLLLVHGDTATTFASALAAYHSKVKIGHVEAGLRTGNLYSPWPEEANRKLTGSISNFHFAPTKLARKNLIAEGVESKNIHVTGNTVIDALLMGLQFIKSDSEFIRKICNRFNFLNSKNRMVLVTGHRRESFGSGFKNICDAIAELANTKPEVNFVYPVHLNPNILEPAHRILANVKNIHLIEPVDYLSFIYLMSKAYIVLTDSGGIQEEAPSLDKPVLVMRDLTERKEAIQAGTVKLVGTERKTIVSNVLELLEKPDSYEEMKNSINPYGDGNASIRISKILESPTNVF